MDSIIRDDPVEPVVVEAPQKETRKLKFLRVLNFMILGIFGMVWSLNFIWIGWAGLYGITMVFALVYTVFNAFFALAKHSQRMSPFKTPSTMSIIYVVQILALVQCLSFFVTGCINV